jgi:hypothetical protein
MMIDKAKSIAEGHTLTSDGVLFVFRELQEEVRGSAGALSGSEPYGASLMNRVRAANSARNIALEQVPGIAGS